MSPKNMTEALAERRRLLILKYLLERNAYTASSVDIRQSIAILGHDVSHDRIANDLAWLEEQDTIIRQAQGTVVTLTSRGGDIAECRTSIPGISRPLPGE